LLGDVIPSLNSSLSSSSSSSTATTGQLIDISSSTTSGSSSATNVKSKTQEVFIAYKNSLITIKSKLAENVGNTEGIKNLTNLAGGVLKTVLIFLTNFEQNEKAVKLLHVLLYFSQEFGLKARNAAIKSNDSDAVHQLAELIGKMITAIDDHIEFLY